LYLFGSDGTVLWANLDDGTCHDNTLYLGLYLELVKMKIYEHGLKMLGDKAFSSSDVLARPFKAQEYLGKSDEERVRMDDYNRKVIGVRQAAESGVKDVKRLSLFSTKYPKSNEKAAILWRIGP